MTRPIISITCDFGIKSHGVGIMKGVALGINPEANVILLTPEVPGFDIKSGARVMESVSYLPTSYHVCVVDPGVGTQRKAIIIETVRGDYLVGPDNGVLLSATDFLGGIKNVVEITNEKYMRKPVSSVFHGRDIFTPAAAWLSTEIPIGEFGQPLHPSTLVKAPYENAKVENGKIEAEIININNFGSVFFNIKAEQLEEAGFKQGDNLVLLHRAQCIPVPLLATFGEVDSGKLLLFPDDFGRVELSVNQGNAAVELCINSGDRVVIEKKKSG